MCPAGSVLYLLLIFSPVDGSLEKAIEHCSAASCEKNRKLIGIVSTQKDVRSVPKLNDLVCTKK